MKQGEMKKFKDIHALEQAYFALEKEFTRKCQRLRELEKLLGTMEENSTPSRGRDCAEDGRTVLPQTEQTAPAPCKGTDDPDLKVGPLPENRDGQDWEKQSLLLGRILDDSLLTAKFPRLAHRYGRRRRVLPRAGAPPQIIGGGFGNGEKLSFPKLTGLIKKRRYELW